MTLLEQVLHERWPSPATVEAECERPIPERAWTRGGMGLTRFQVLLAIAKRAGS